MALIKKLDEIDKKIITILSGNPDASQDFIASEVKVTQPSVAARIKKLKKIGAIESIIGINPTKMGLHIGKVDISSTNTSEIMNMFKDCPYFMNGYTVSGRYNLCLFFMSENISTMESIINGHIRTSPYVKDLEFNIIINSEKPIITNVKLNLENRSIPPCGISMDCKDCSSFKEKKCMGCPTTGSYQGELF